jgi:hypothetical protein
VVHGKRGGLRINREGLFWQNFVLRYGDWEMPGEGVSLPL